MLSQAVRSRAALVFALLVLFFSATAANTAQAASVTEQASELGRDISRTARKTWEAVEHRDPRKLSAGQLLGLLIVGALVGALAGMALTSKAKGFGPGKNLLVGILGAFLGGVIVDAFHIDFGWGAVVIGYEQVAAAFLVAIACVLAGRATTSLWRRTFKGGKGRSEKPEKADR